GRGLDLDDLAFEPASDHRTDRVDHAAIVVDDEDLDRSHHSTSAAAGQPNEERWSIRRSTIHDPTVVRLARETAKVETEAALAVGATSIFAEQIAFDFGRDGRPVVEDTDLYAMWVGRIQPLCSESDLSIGLAVADRVADEVVQHAFHERGVEVTCEIGGAVDRDRDLAADGVDLDDAVQQTTDSVDRALRLHRGVFEPRDVDEVGHQARHAAQRVAG